MATSLKQDLLAMRRAKKTAEDLGRRQKTASADFKQRQARAFERMQNDDIESLKTGGTLFSLVEKVQARCNDRARYVRWALEQDEGVADFLARLDSLAETVDESEEMAQQFVDVVMNLELLDLKEKGDALNQLVRAAIDDGHPLPPGTTFDPANYISQRAA